MAISSACLAEYSLAVTIDDISDEVKEKIRRHLLDSIACCIGAYTSPPSKNLRRQMDAERGGTNRGTVFGSGNKVPVEYSALINSTMCRYLDFNDGYTTAYGAGHPSDHIPALISVAESERATGADLVEAIAVAYDIQCSGLETGAFYEYNLDTQCVWGSFSATSAVGKIMGLSEDELVNALGISGASNNGLSIARRGAISMWKGMAMPYVIHNAIQACQMARAGITGPEEVFEGEGGVFEVLSHGEIELPLSDSPGDRVLMANLKPFAGCYSTLSSVTGVLNLVKENDIDADDIDTIDIQTFDIAAHSTASPEKWDTDLTRETADHSLPYVIAVTAIDRELTPKQYRSDRLHAEEVHELMQKVSVSEDEELTSARRSNSGLTPSNITMETAGASYETRVDHPPGHHTKPLDRARHEEKVRNLMTPYLTEGAISSTIDYCYDIDDSNDLKELLNLLLI